jgi:hypothetical protein
MRRREFIAGLGSAAAWHPPSPDCAINMPHKFILGQRSNIIHLAGSMRRLEFTW